MEKTTFRTQFNTNPEKNQIDYSSEIVLFGSCFSENIGNKLDYFKFNSTTNPYGILFNPIAIENSIAECVTNRRYTKEDLIFHNELWHSFNHHSDFSDMDYNVVLNNINTSIKKTHEQLKTASHILITLGTAWVYHYLESQLPVANCHKIPQKKFTKKILTVEDIEHSISIIKKAVLKLNPDAIFIFTVSPVRHLKDGMVENTLSKSHLLTAIHKSLDNKTNYFPAYEIMMDDLRDYRFYSDDMLHPSKIAINYIWDIFCSSWLSKNIDHIKKEVSIVQKGLSHRPFNPDSKNHKEFANQLKDKITKLSKNHNIIF